MPTLALAFAVCASDERHNIKDDLEEALEETTAEDAAMQVMLSMYHSAFSALLDKDIDPERRERVRVQLRELGSEIAHGRERARDREYGSMGRLIQEIVDDIIHGDD